MRVRACLLAVYMHSQGDVWLWERLLEQSSASVPYLPEASLQWACLAATASEKPEVAVAMLTNPDIKRALVSLADDDGLLPSWTAEDGGEAGTSAGSHDHAQAVPPGGADGSSSDWWRTASADHLEAAYARLALHHLAQTADLTDPSELSPDELAERQEPFTKRYLHYTSPPLPSRPPPHALAPPDYERLAASIASVVFCGVGGLVWGGLVGALPSSRMRRPVWRSALATTVGAIAFEGAMQLKLAASYRVRAMSKTPPRLAASSNGNGAGSESDGSGGSGGSGVVWGGGSGGQRFGGGAAPVPLYRTLSGLVSGVCADIALSSAVLLALVQPHRAPLTFGGWAIGRLACLSQEVEVAGVVVEVVDDE